MRREIVGRVRMDQRSAVTHRFLKVDLHIERIVVDLDERRSVFGDITIDSNHHGDRLPDVINVPARQRTLRVRMLHRGMGNEQRHVEIEIADIVAGIDRRYAGMPLRRGGIDRADARARKRTAHKGGMQRLRQRDIIDERAFAAQQLGIDVTLDACSELAG